MSFFFPIDTGGASAPPPPPPPVLAGDYLPCLQSVTISGLLVQTALGAVTIATATSKIAAEQSVVIVSRDGIYFLVETIDLILSGNAGDC